MQDPNPPRPRRITASLRPFQREYVRALSRSAVRANLLPVDALALSLIFDSPACTPSYLAHYLTLSGGAVTSLVDRLQRQGLVTRERGLHDRRRVDLTLTNAGRDRAELIRGVTDDVIEHSASEMDVDAITEFLDDTTVALESSVETR